MATSPCHPCRRHLFLVSGPKLTTTSNRNLHYCCWHNLHRCTHRSHIDSHRCCAHHLGRRSTDDDDRGSTTTDDYDRRCRWWRNDACCRWIDVHSWIRIRFVYYYDAQWGRKDGRCWWCSRGPCRCPGHCGLSVWSSSSFGCGTRTGGVPCVFIKHDSAYAHSDSVICCLPLPLFFPFSLSFSFLLFLSLSCHLWTYPPPPLSPLPSTRLQPHRLMDMPDNPHPIPLSFFCIRTLPSLFPLISPYHFFGSDRTPRVLGFAVSI